MCKILHWNGTVSEIAPFSLLSLGNYDEVIFAYICWSRTAYLPRITLKVNETTDRHQALCSSRSPSLRVSVCVRGSEVEYESTINSVRASQRERKKKVVACRCHHCKLSQWFMKISIRKSSRIQFSLNLLSLNFRLLYIYQIICKSIRFAGIFTLLIWSAMSQKESERVNKTE